MRLRASWLALSFLVVAAVGTSGAQGTTSRLAGQVSDSTGAVLPGVTVTLTNDATGVTFTSVTTGAGTYTFEALPSGSYSVKFELQGFKTFVSRENRVVVGQPTTVDAQLAPGELAETVQVTGRVEVVQTNNSGNLGSVVDQRTIEAFPLVSGGGRGRNPLDIVLIQPGVVSGANTGGGTHVNGARDRSWNFTLDGIDTNETSAGGANFSPLRTNPDALSEFKILTGNTTAEFGRNSGGQVAMITRSGTNQYRGTVFYFMRRPELNANEWEYNVAGTPEAEREPGHLRLQPGRADPEEQAVLLRQPPGAPREADRGHHQHGVHRFGQERDLALRRRRPEPARRRRRRDGGLVGQRAPGHPDRDLQHPRQRPAGPGAEPVHPAAAGEDAVAEHVHDGRRAQHGRPPVQRRRRGEAVRFDDPGRLRVQQHALLLRPRLLGPAGHLLRQRQRRPGPRIPAADAS